MGTCARRRMNEHSGPMGRRVEKDNILVVGKLVPFGQFNYSFACFDYKCNYVLKYKICHIDFHIFAPL